MSSRRALFLFSKPARPGRVKTRLIGELSAEQAAEIHEAFLGDVVERLTGGDFELRMAWALDDGGVAPFDPPPGVEQRGADLGERLFHALAEADSDLVAVMGSDHPTVPREVVEEGFQRLEAGADLTIGPADDGGYYLLAVRSTRLSPELFQGIAWSTPTVLATTLEKAKSLGMKVELLPVGSDVDTPADLERLAQRLSREPELSCPRTRALLNRWGRLAPGGAAGAG